MYLHLHKFIIYNNYAKYGEALDNKLKNIYMGFQEVQGYKSWEEEISEMKQLNLILLKTRDG